MATRRYDRVELVDLISQLQSLWSIEDDLGLTRLARTSLALEQLLERFCSRTLEFNAERLADVTAAIEVFQDLLLGFEATREEPAFSSVDSILRLERHARRPHRSDIVQAEIESGEGLIESPATSVMTNVPAESPIVIDTPLVPSTPMRLEQTIEPSVIAMLEQFVTKLDDTCHRLHARMLRDETPYVTTTSRLEYLSQATRDLVEQIARAAQTPAVVLRNELTAPSEHPVVANGERPLRVTSESATALISRTDLPRLTDAAHVAPRLPHLDSISMTAAVLRQTGFEHSGPESRRILILEESLFYRHFVSIALESAGYEPFATETIEDARKALDSPTDFCAVLVSAKASSALAETIKAGHRKHSFKVVLLTTSSNSETDACEVDDRVSISHPQRLVAVLERLLGHPPRGTRRPA